MTPFAQPATVGAVVSEEPVDRTMSSLLRLVTARRLLAAVLLAAAVVGCADRGPPSSSELADLSGEDVLDLLGDEHDDGDREICGEDSTSDYEGATVAHGLDFTSEVPAEAVAEIERLGSKLDDHEQRHFDTHRLLLISWDPTSADLGEGYGTELGSVYELHYWEDEHSIGWGVVYSGSVFECPADWPD